ncbi:MAG: hypothetical protein LUC39_08465, partial [Clostridiales bacterium]|nr:hypothetical protein [Clostridiales bacterium]
IRCSPDCQAFFCGFFQVFSGGLSKKASSRFPFCGSQKQLYFISIDLSIYFSFVVPFSVCAL